MILADKPMRVIRKTLLLLALLSPGMNLRAAEPPGDSVRVSVHREDETVTIDVDMRVPVSPWKAWAVLTDFEHMAGFLPNVRESHVIGQAGLRLTVLQKGETRLGLLSLAFESVREVELKPYESIRSVSIRGSMRKMESKTTLIPEGQGVHIRYHAVAIPDTALAGLVPADVVGDEVRIQFKAMREEILRREVERMAGVRRARAVSRFS